MLPRLRGAFSIVVMTKDRVVAFRDPHGLRPLAIGALEPGPDEPDGERALLRGERVVRVRHHRREATCATSSRARWSRSARTGLQSRMVVPGGTARVLRVRVHLLRAPGLAHERPGAAGRARAHGRDPVARGAGRGRPRDRRARLRQPRRARPRARRRACPRTTASSRTATSRAPSSSPARSCASTACA